MSLVVEKNELLDPVYVSFFSAGAVVTGPESASNLFEEFRLSRRARCPLCPDLPSRAPIR
jgi:hypothetical protein